MNALINLSRIFSIPLLIAAGWMGWNGWSLWRDAVADTTPRTLEALRNSGTPRGWLEDSVVLDLRQAGWRRTVVLGGLMTRDEAVVPVRGVADTISDTAFAVLVSARPEHIGPLVRWILVRDTIPAYAGKGMRLMGENSGPMVDPHVRAKLILLAEELGQSTFLDQEPRIHLRAVSTWSERAVVPELTTTTPRILLLSEGIPSKSNAMGQLVGAGALFALFAGLTVWDVRTTSRLRREHEQEMEDDLREQT